MGLARRRLAGGQEGMTMIEVMVAALILVIGSLAVLSLVGASAHNSYRAEQSQVVSNRLQQEMEKIQQLSYDQVALTGLPPDSSDPHVPSWRVSGTSFSVTQDGTQLRSLVYNGSSLYPSGTVSGGAVDPTPTHFTSGDVSGTIYRFVVWENDPSCVIGGIDYCPGSQDLKRVIVAILLDGGPVGGTIRHYQEIQSQITNPASQPVDNPSPPCQTGCSNDGTPWTFWLTDTSCDKGSRQPITADHLMHNTRGLCSAGQRTGNDPGAPDLMVNQAAPLTAETPLFDYATDVEPSLNPDQDKGLQLLRGTSTSCDPDALTVATGAESDPSHFQQLHEWLSPPIPAGRDVQLDGTGTLNLWTQTVNAASYAGKICVWVFVRSTDGSGNTVQTAATGTTGAPYFTYSLTQWPTGWSEVHMPLSFTLGTHLTEGTRLGLAVGVDRDGTGSDGMQILYDEPSFDSRIELKTHSAVPTL